MLSHKSKRCTRPRSHIAMRVFRYLFLSTVLLSVLITGLYGLSSYQDYSDLQVANGNRVVETISNQIASTESTMLDLNALLFSSDAIYQYLSSTAGSMPSMDWFSAWNEVNSTLILWGRSQINTVLGLMLYRTPEDSVQYGSFYTALDPYQLSDEQMDRLLAIDGHLFFVSSVHIGTYRNSYIVVQLHDTVFDALCEDLLVTGGAMELLDAAGRQIRGYSATPFAFPITAPNAFQMLDHSLESCGWVVRLYLPADNLSDFLTQALPWILSTLLIAFLLSLVLSLHLSFSLSRGFKHLHTNILHVEKGEYARVDSMEGEDELAKTSRSLKHMAMELERLHQESQQRTEYEHQLELQVLRSQVSPHFLYNALCSVRQLCSMQGLTHIAQMCTSLIQLLRATLANEGILVPLQQELQYVHYYYDICQYQLADEVTIREQIDASCRQASVVHMILQPIVENAMLHGLAGVQRNGIILIRAVQDGSVMRISVTDNGQGMDAQVLSSLMHQERNANHRRFSGIGIRNVHERIRLRFGKPYGLSVSSRVGHFTRVDILLPYLRHEEVLHETHSASGR